MSWGPAFFLASVVYEVAGWRLSAWVCFAVAVVAGCVELAHG